MRGGLGAFDAVCMATSLHALASLRATPQAYADLFQRAEARALMAHISALAEGAVMVIFHLCGVSQQLI